MNIDNLVLVTSEPKKVREIELALRVSIRSVHLDLPEIQTVDIEEMIHAKAKEAFKQLGQPVLVEDTGLYIVTWNGLPGALTKWFLKTVGNDGICRMMSQFADRRCIARTVIGFTDGKDFIAFAGEVNGSIAPEPKGDNKFGWDPIFLPDGSVKTFGEMGLEEKNSLSMRALAVNRLCEYFGVQRR